MSTRNDLANEMTGEGEISATSSGVGSEVLAQAIEDLTVKDKDTNEGPNSEEEAVIKEEEESSARAFSPSSLNSSLPPINTGYYASNFNTRTTSPIMQESVSPTFGMGSHATNSSPSTSQVSVGSVGPTLVASLLNQRHHYDLTPVMRNTTTSGDVHPFGPGMGHNAGADDNGVVSPDTVEEENADFLHGEHLSLPADLSTADDGGVILPNLRKSTIPTLPMQRAKSLGTAAHMSFTDMPDMPKASIGIHRLAELPPPAPVEFPSRKYYSFTSREQYKGIAVGDDEDLSEEESLEERPDLTPYQPTRQEFAEIEESMPPEALNSIFIERRRRRSLHGTSVAEVQEEVVDEESSHKNHRLLQNPIPMTDRQWSIPSLRMGQRLATDGSLASLTDNLDDESLLYVLPYGGNGAMTDEDEASLSSRASSLYLSIGGSGVPSAVPTSIMEEHRQESAKIPEPSTIWNDDNSSSVMSQHRSTGSASFEGVPSFGSAPTETTNKVVVESPWNLLTGTHSSLSDENSAVAVDGDRALRRKRKQRQREEAALSWLQSLQQQSTEPPVAEAASSKFLTGRTQTHAFCKTNNPTSDDATARAAVISEGHRPS